ESAASRSPNRPPDRWPATVRSDAGSHFSARRARCLRWGRRPAAASQEIVRLASGHEETIKRWHDDGVPLRVIRLLPFGLFVWCAVLGAQIDPRAALIERAAWTAL